VTHRGPFQPLPCWDSVKKSAVFSTVGGLMLFPRYLEAWDGNISKSPCFTGLNLNIGAQSMWFATKNPKPLASWRSAAAPGELPHSGRAASSELSSSAPEKPLAKGREAWRRPASPSQRENFSLMAETGSVWA